MLDDLNELRTFQRILALGSLSAAARDLQVGLAVVSKRLVTLERRAGVRLVNRTTRSLSATDEGRALFGHVERLLDELATAEARLSSGREEPHGILRLAAPISFGRIHVVPVAAALTEQYPHLDVDLSLDDNLVDLVESRIDVAVRIGQPKDSSAIMRKLADNHRILVAAPSYFATRGHPTDPTDLSDHTFLRYGDSSEPWRLQGPDGRIVEVEAPCRMRANSGDAVHEWALTGRGVMFKSRLDVAADLAKGRLERMLPEWRSEPAPVYALFPSSRHLAIKARVFIEAMAARLSGL